MREPLGVFLEGHQTELFVHLGEHLYLTGISVLFAAVLGIPLGIWVYRHPLRRGIALGIANVVQTIPSLALLAFLLPFFGIGARPVIAALVLYGLLPIIRGTVTGLQEVPAETREAGGGIGMSKIQLLWRVEIPLALPSIMGGLRLATVWSVGTATLGSLIGAGGLGDFITRGLPTNNIRLVLLGAIPAALLAIILDFAIGRLQVFLQPWKRGER